jgi:hypothetical protein
MAETVEPEVLVVMVVQTPWVGLELLVETVEQLEPFMLEDLLDKVLV